MAEYREILVVRISKLKGYTAYGSTPFYLISRLIKLHNRWGFVFMMGAMVSLVTLAFSLLGESLSEILNPRLAEL